MYAPPAPRAAAPAMHGWPATARGLVGTAARPLYCPAPRMSTLAMVTIVSSVAGRGRPLCTPVVNVSGVLTPDCSTHNPPPASSCTAPSLAPLKPMERGFTIRFSAYIDLREEGTGKPYQMGLLSQCDCVCNRADPSREPLHSGGFLLATTNCRDPRNQSDPQCNQATYTNLSFYLANTNYTWANGTVNASLEDTGAHGWVEGPPMLNGTWNDVSVVWRPDSEKPDTGTLSMTVTNPSMPSKTTSRTLCNASNIVPPHGTPFWFGTSRFPNLAPCHPFFGRLRDLTVWNGAACGPDR